MKAVICTNYGSPEVLQLQNIEKPIPRSNEVLIKIKATTVTAADFRIRSFTVPKAFWLPARLALGWQKPKQNILGVELAGEVEAVGKDVTLFKKGDQVFAASLKTFGGYAEYKCLPENDPIAIKPANLSYEEAAALPIGARTALYFLKKGHVKKGQKVLIYGASGSVGTYAVQLARYFGAEVTAVCSGANTSLVKSLGADKALDYTDSGFVEKLEIYDMVFLAVNKLPYSICRKILKDRGTYINITDPIKNALQLRDSLTGKKMVIMAGNAPEKAQDMEELKNLIEKGIIKPVIDKSYRLEQIVEAHRYVDTGHKKGNVVITVN